MLKLPITRITLYKHEVGFYERRADIDDKEIELIFRANEMNDCLENTTFSCFAVSSRHDIFLENT
jgi:hypothetical protein